MKTTFIILAIAALAGCAAQPQGPYIPVNPVIAQCNYEAGIAVANIRNIMEAEMTRASLRQQCINIRSAGK